MAESKSSGKARESDLQTVRQLVEVAAVDTVFRDLYLQRAVELLAPSLTIAEYHRLKKEPAEVDDLLRQTRQAVAQQEWTRVQELTGRVAALRSVLESRQSEVRLADEVYGAAEVVVDPFSPGFDVLLSKTDQAKIALRDQAVAALTALEKSDPPRRSFYAGRRSHFAALSLTATTAAERTPALDNLEKLQEQALQAAEHGDVDELKRLAQAALTVQAETRAAASSTAEERISTAQKQAPRELAEPFPARAIEGGAALGMAHVQAKIRPGMSHLAAQTRDRYGWRPFFPATELAREGELRLRPLLEAAKVPQEMVEPLLDVTALFALHPFINGGGVRYYPLFPESESVLVEDFPEDVPPSTGSDLLKALGLPRRAGLSRLEIEVALLGHGAALLEERLGVDPVKFRLVCIPYDLYGRIGQERGWGRQPRWTHVDGYQVLKGGRLRALVAGDVRFGGLFDLCSISSIDEREGVTARFAVIHRERFMAG